MRIYALSLAIGLLIALPALAADEGVPSPGACKEVETCGAPDCCAHCGCRSGCEKYCRVVCDVKEIKKTVWVVKCEEFCAPLPGCPLGCKKCCESCGQQCTSETCCNNCGKCDPCASLLARPQVPPKCGKVREKKTLEKKEITCKVPSYKCVVTYACGNCGNKCGGEKIQNPAEGNPAPVPAPAPKAANNVAPLPPAPALGT